LTFGFSDDFLPVSKNHSICVFFVGVIVFSRRDPLGHARKIHQEKLEVSWVKKRADFETKKHAENALKIAGF
jgi:hypothetical protein